MSPVFEIETLHETGSPASTFVEEGFANWSKTTFGVGRISIIALAASLFVVACSRTSNGSICTLNRCWPSPRFWICPQLKFVLQSVLTSSEVPVIETVIGWMTIGDPVWSGKLNPKLTLLSPLKCLRRIVPDTSQSPRMELLGVSTIGSETCR